MALTRYTKRLAAVPALAEFCRRAEELLSASDPETFWGIEPAFKELLESDFVEAFVLHQLSAIAEDSFYPVLDSSEIEAPLVQSEAYSLVLKLLPADGAMISQLFSPAKHQLLAVHEGSAEVETFTFQQPFRHDVFDRSQRLVAGETIRLSPGRIGRFRSPQDIPKVQVKRPTLLVQLQSATTVPLQWVFDAKTLEPVRALAARLSSSRLQFTCVTLAALGSTRSIPALKRLTTHPEHYVRWAAVQGICAISLEDGLESLHKSLDDDHPHIRIAAQNTLTAL